MVNLDSDDKSNVRQLMIMNFEKLGAEDIK